jgi:hypothetical protein
MANVQTTNPYNFPYAIPNIVPPAKVIIDEGRVIGTQIKYKLEKAKNPLLGWA